MIPIPDSIKTAVSFVIVVAMAITLAVISSSTRPTMLKFVINGAVLWFSAPWLLQSLKHFKPRASKWAVAIQVVDVVAPIIIIAFLFWDTYVVLWGGRLVKMGMGPEGVWSLWHLVFLLVSGFVILRSGR